MSAHPGVYWPYCQSQGRRREGEREWEGGEEGEREGNREREREGKRERERVWEGEREW